MMTFAVKPMLIAALAMGPIAACSSEKIFDNTTDSVVFVGKTAAKGAYGASRLVVRGAAAGVKRLQRPADGYEAGEIVCLNTSGQTYAAAVLEGDKYVCPDPS
ncbi:hypothetical protein IV417_18225 [Alphaproteobacteria bacterium KMM 3653]|uniref:Lipoprotein n=1 Tax=Harenicola maris TaxID=2841044 RepID=A0AAP2CVK6_9RHOB|nr:hypothetical protein [Harenicola maris]